MVRVLFRGYWQRSGLEQHYEISLGELTGYWAAYGRTSALVRSPALWFALVITLICTPLWTAQTWADLPLQILPNLLGFSLGSLAIILAIPTTKIFKDISEDGRPDSFYIELCAKFVHFIFAQVVAILLALLSKAISLGQTIWFVGFWAFVYAILTAALTALALFGVAQIYNDPAAPRE